MKKIDDKELKKVNGGFTGWTIAGIALIVTFVAGVVDGIAKPRSCEEAQMKVRDIELHKVSGGSDIASSLLKYLSDALDTVFNIGQHLGEAIRRIATNNTCPL